MGTLTDIIRQTGRQSAIPSESGAGVGQIDEREQAIIDRHKKGARSGSLFQDIAQGYAEIEIDTRRKQREYAEQSPPEAVEPVKEMLSSTGDRRRMLGVLRQMTPEQRAEALKLAPGVAQQLGDDRGNIAQRGLHALSRGVTSVTQPWQELVGLGGTAEEIEFIRQIEGASQEFSPARDGDPWYEKFPLQATEMTPFSVTAVGGGLGGAGLSKAGGQLLARSASAGVPGAQATFKAIGAAGKLPKVVGLAGATTKGTMAGLGTVAGITAIGAPMQYAQEIDQLKALGMEDGARMKALATGTALVTSALESLMPNPFPAGTVDLKSGALKAARQYLWEATKRAPVEMSEEYAQGLSSGLGKIVANYIDENAEEKTLSDAFAMSYEQGNEALGPMAFMLGVPASINATRAAARAQQLSRLQEIRAKGFVSEQDAKEIGIEGKNRKERFANANEKAAQLEEEAKQEQQYKNWNDFGTGEPQGEIPAPPGLGLLDRLRGKSSATQAPLVVDKTAEDKIIREPISQPLPKGATDAQVRQNDEEMQGQARVEGEQEARIQGEQTSQADAGTEVQVEQPQSASSFLREKFPNDPGVDDAILKYGAEEVARHHGWKPPTVTPEEARKGNIARMLYDARAENEGFAIPPMTIDDIDNEVELLEEKLKRGKKLSKDDIRTLRQRAALSASMGANEAIENDAEAFIRELRNQVDAIKAGEVAKPPATKPVDTERDEVEDELAGLLGEEEVPAPKQKKKEKVSPIGEKSNETPTPPKAAGEDQSSEVKSEPRVTAYHGAADEFAEFDPKRMGERDAGYFGKGFYFTDKPGVAQQYGDVAAGKENAGKVITAELDTSKFLKTTPGQLRETYGNISGEELTKALQKDGYQGVSVTKQSGNVEHVVFDTASINIKRDGKGGIAPAASGPAQIGQSGISESNQSSEAPDKPIKLGRKGAIKPARKMEPTEEGRPVDGKPIMPGDRFVTNTGRETTPYPKYSGSTNRQVINAEKKSQLWLMENALAEAESRGDEFNARTFRSELEDARKGKLPQASKDSATLYVFGEDVPEVPKPLLKDPAKRKRRTDQPGQKPREKDKPKGIVVYHGRRAVFPVSEFRVGGETSLLGRGIWFTEDEQAANAYSSIDPSVNVDVPGQIEALAEQLGISYREAKQAWTEGAEPNVIKVSLDIKRPLELSPTTPIAVSEGQFKLAAAEADVSLPDNAYKTFVGKGNAKDQIEYLQRIKASQMVSRIASIQNHDAIIFREGLAPRSKGTEYLVLDKAAIREEAPAAKGIQEKKTPSDSKSVAYKIKASLEAKEAFNNAVQQVNSLMPGGINLEGYDVVIKKNFAKADIEKGAGGSVYGNTISIVDVGGHHPYDAMKTGITTDQRNEAMLHELIHVWQKQSNAFDGRKFTEIEYTNRPTEIHARFAAAYIHNMEKVNAGEMEQEKFDRFFKPEHLTSEFALNKHINKTQSQEDLSKDKKPSVPTTDYKPSVEPATEPLTEPEIPAFTRTTPDKGSTTRTFQSERVEKARADIADLERKRRAKRGEHDGLRSNATKKRAAVRGEIESFNRMIGKIEGEIASDMASDTLAKLEDELESPRSYDHYLAGMKAIHRLNASAAEDAARRGDMGRESARVKVTKEQKEADRLDAELQSRAKEIAMSLGFTSGDADQIALSASNGFTIFEDRSLADIVDVQGRRTRESRVSQEINKLKPDSPYGRQQDLSNEQISEFTKQYQEASLDDKDWLAKRGKVDKAVKDAIEASRAAARKREDDERKVKEAEKAKNEQEALANARERAKKYFLDERISKSLKKQNPKTKPVKIRRESVGGPVKIVEGKTVDGDQNGELYPNGLILHKSFEEDSKDFVLTHARSGFGFPFSAKKSDMKELIGLIDVLGVDFNVDTDEKGALPAELQARMKKINTAWDNGDYAMLSEQDYATVQALSEVAKTDIGADLILTADDLGANGIPPGLGNVMTDKGLRLVKQMAIAVPEFSYDPVFTVADGKLLYRDGFEFKLEPTAFNLHPSELKEGQTVGINLEDLGIKRFTPQDVVAEMMKQAGLPKVTKAKGGDVSVGYSGAKPTLLEQGKDDNEWNVVGGTPKVQEMAVSVLKKIRWRQPGQDGDPKTDIDVVPVTEKEQTSDNQSEPAPKIDPFDERSSESAERRKLIAEARDEMRPYYQIDPEVSVYEGIRNAVDSFVAGAPDSARITGGADGKALVFDGSTKQWNAIVKRAQTIADKTNAVHAVVAVGDIETGIPSHAVIISSPGFVGSTFESQNSKPWFWGNTIESLYPELPTSIVVPKNPQATEAVAVDNTKRIQEIDKEIENLQSQYEKKMAAQGKSAMVPPSIKGDALSQITKKMDKLDAEKASLQKPIEKDEAKTEVATKPEAATASEPVTETQPSAPVQADFMEMSNGVNAPGVKKTIRVTAGERTLLMEKGKADNEWSIREGEKYTGEVKGKTPVKKGGELLVSGIVETKKAKDIAQRIIDGTFDKDADNRFVRDDTQNIGLTNASIASSIKDSLQRRGSFAKLLRENGLVTDGRLLMKVSDKDRDAILKAVGETDEGRDLGAVAKMMEDGQKALSRSANAMKPIGYRGGYLVPRTVVLQSQDGDFAIIDKSLHDTVLKKYPDAVPYFLEDVKPISYTSDDNLVAIVMPMNMNKPDSTVKELVSGKYDFEAAAAEAAKFPPPQPKSKLKKAAEKANKELASAVDELGKVIKRRPSASANLPNPEVIAAAAKVVAKAIQAGALNFAELMERMVTKYGEKMAKRMEAVLQQEWDRQVNVYPVEEDGTPPETPQPHPELVPPESIPLTSVKNAIVDELRTQRGEDLMPDVTPQTVQQWLDAAGNRIANDPYAGNTLVEQLISGDKTSVDEMEGMVLQYHYRAVNNLFEAADAKLTDAKASGDAAEIAIAQDEARVIMRRLSAIETALDKAGTAWGRAGVSRQIFLKQDFSLASMVRRARVANGGNELTDAQVATISEQSKKIEELQKQLAGLEAKLVEQEQAKAIDDGIKNDIDDSKRKAVKPKSKVRLKAEARVASAWEKVSAVLSGKTYSNPVDLELLKPALELVKAYADLGVVAFREFMSVVSQNMGAKEAKASEPTFRAAWDQLQSEGELTQPELDMTSPGKLTRFARQVQRTLIENGIREREAVVDGVHAALQEIIPDITRRQAMDALSSYGQFSQLSKDPIDQIVRDINGQLQQLAKLEDMQKGQAPAKTGVERRTMSDEERRLTQLVNEAKRRGGFVVTDPETQLKSAMGAAKTAIRNRIADMNYEIKSGSRIVRNKTELIPDAELEQLRKDRDELQKVHKEMFPPKGATQAQKIAAANRALDAAIANLEAKLAAGDAAPTPQPLPLSTPELDAKRARLKALNEQRNALRKIANPNMTAEQIKLRAMDRSIAELEKQLATGNFAPKPKAAPLTSPEILARQAKLDELRATKKAILDAANPKMTPEERASRAYEAYLRKQLATYLERIAQSDFSKPKKTPRVLTKTELDLKKQLADVKHDFFEALSKYHLDNLSPGGRAIDIVRESAHLSRAIMTSIDLSAVLRQGGLGVYSHPVMARKAAGEMWHSIWSREKEFQSMERLRMRPNAQLYEESGLNITDSEGKLTRQEEAFMGRWARTGVDFAGEKVQAATKLALEPVAASARAYVTFINNLRADLFDVMVENLGRSGQVTKEEAKLIASYVNVATGRSDLKSLNEKAATLNTVLFAPRYVASRFQYLAMPFYLLGTKDSGRVKRLIAKEYARTFTGAAVFIGSLVVLGHLAAGDDEEEKTSLEINPLSSDLLKPRIGETRIDALAGLAQVIVLSSRMASFRTKSSVTGKVKPFYEVGPYETTHGSEALRFLRTKLAPVPGAVVTAMSGMENVVGDPVTPAGLVGGLFAPISVGEVVSTMQHRGIPKGTALTILNLLGASVNTYGPKTAYLDATPEERAKQVNDYIKYMDWESELPAFSQYLAQEDLKRVQDRQNERRGDLIFEAMEELKPKSEYKTEVHYEEAAERHEKVRTDFEEFRKEYAQTYADALQYLHHHFGDEGGIKIKGGGGKVKPSFKERRKRLEAYYQSLAE